MFGENKIIGRKNSILDSKNRTSIPQFSGIEQGDKLVLIQENEDSFSIYEKKYYLEQIKILESKLEEIKDINILIELKKYIEMEYMKIVKELNCDKQHRVVLTEEVPKEITFFGCGDHLKMKRLEKNN